MSVTLSRFRPRIHQDLPCHGWPRYFVDASPIMSQSHSHVRIDTDAADKNPYCFRIVSVASVFSSMYPDLSAIIRRDIRRNTWKYFSSFENFKTFENNSTDVLSAFIRSAVRICPYLSVSIGNHAYLSVSVRIYK